MFSFGIMKMLKININFQWYISHISELVALEKSYLSWMVPDKDTLYIKIITLDEIYNFLVLSFINWGC
jgi:hypothetical protein